MKKAISKHQENDNVSLKGSDIIELILTDHKQLKKLVKLMKNLELSESKRREAFDEFAPLLMAHAKPEAEVLYSAIKGDDALRVEAFEGEVEHDLAEMMLQEAKSTTDTDVWSAKVKVLAELVEHHIEEEEEDLLPDYKKASERTERLELGQKFLDAKEQYEDWDFDSDVIPMAAKDKSHKRFEPIQHQ